MSEDSLTGHQARPLVLTGADSHYARSLAQFLLSAERQGEHLIADWAVLDLGLAPEDRCQLAARFAWIEIRRPDFDLFPAHVAVEAGSYAWKPALLREAAKGRTGLLFWFDSGTILRLPLDAARAALREQGFWGLRSQMPLAEKCDARVMDALGVPLEVRHLREYAAGAVGFDLATPFGRQLVDDWGANALVAEHIVPPGYAPFHKHDQALLNCLLAKAVHAGTFRPTEDEIDISSAAPSPLLSSRNFVSGKVPLWADPFVRIGGAGRKAADRLYHRLRHFDDTRIDGWRRRRKEHFLVRIRDAATGRETTIPDPHGGYYADPFLLQREGRTWVFVEEFVYARDRGHLSVLEIDGASAVVSARPLQLLPDHHALDCHASFPYIFADGGRIWMIPETHERRSVDLFVCTRWPDRWELARRLLFGLDAVDTMAVHHQGEWYLITSVRGAWPNRHLEIHHASDLLTGHFRPHPVNALGLYGSSLFGTGRNAGLIVEGADGSMQRLMQWSQ